MLFKNKNPQRYREVLRGRPEWGRGAGRAHFNWSTALLPALGLSALFPSTKPRAGCKVGTQMCNEQILIVRSVFHFVFNKLRL